jgi:flagellar protein FlbD
MIKVTKLDGREILISPESIKYVESTPDTLIHFLNGDTTLVREDLNQIVEKDRVFRKSLLQGDSTAQPS